MAPRNWNRNHYDPWVFVNRQHINQQNLSQYYVQQQQNQELLNRTQVLRPARKGSDFISGPSKSEVEQVLRQPLQPVKVVNAEKADRAALSGDEIRIYRPQVERPAESSDVLRPAREAVKQEAIRPAQREASPFEPVQPNAGRNTSPAREPQVLPQSRQPDTRREERVIRPQVQPARPAERPAERARNPVMQQQRAIPQSPAPSQTREFRPQPAPQQAPRQVEQRVERPLRAVPQGAEQRKE
jgi:hypothetical protein